MDEKEFFTIVQGLKKKKKNFSNREMISDIFNSL